VSLGFTSERFRLTAEVAGDSKAVPPLDHFVIVDSDEEQEAPDQSFRVKAVDAAALENLKLATGTRAYQFNLLRTGVELTRTSAAVVRKRKQAVVEVAARFGFNLPIDADFKITAAVKTWDEVAHQAQCNLFWKKLGRDGNAATQLLHEEYRLVSNDNDKENKAACAAVHITA
jgi:hypothetical protein